MQGNASVSADVLASYAADAIAQVDGVRGVVDSPLPRHRGVRVNGENGRLELEVHVALDAGVAVGDVGRAVQRAVADYLERMAGTRPVTVEVVVDEIGARP